MNKMKTITMTLALGGFALGGCSAELPDSAETRAKQMGLSCDTQAGTNPMKAALAVAMATEIGRLDPVNDLELSTSTWQVALTGSAKSACNARGYGDCPNTDAILSMQHWSVNNSLDQNVFNATVFKEELKASFDRQVSHENNLSLNAPWRLPGDHELFETGITDHGACGVHYDFNAVGDNVHNLEERMAFFGGDNNPFIDFRSSDSSISIDPTGTMNGDSLTSSGSCVDACYAYNTSLAGSCCTCNGSQGTMYRASWSRSMVYCAY